MLTDEQKRDLKLVNDAFDKIDSKYKPNWLEYERMYESEHTAAYKKATEEQDRNSIFIPLTYSTISIADSVFTTSFFSQGNPIELLKIGDNDADKRSALATVVNYYYEKAKPYNELSKSFLSASLFGIGAVKVYWDDDSALPETDMIPPTEVAFDIDAISRKDTQYISHRFKQTLNDIRDRFKSKFYKCKEANDKDTVIEPTEENGYKRKLIKEIYTKKGKTWQVRTFCGEVCIREVKFKKCPIKHGYLLTRLPRIDDADREHQIAAIGDSLARIIKPLNEELNIKRNQRMDLIERLINPEVYIPKTCSVDPEDAKKIGGIKSCDATTGIMFVPTQGASEFTNDVMMLKNDIEDASSINGIMRGATNASDRRSSTALATVNANSSIRLESMIKLINETLFEEWARDFVRLCYINVDDALVMELTESETNPLGAKGIRPELDIDIKVNFGASINKQAKIQDLLSIVQMVANRKNADVDTVIKEVIKLILGENTNVEKILGVSNQSGDANPPIQNQGVEGSQSAADIEQRGEKGGNGDPIQSVGDAGNRELDKLRNNEV